MGRLHAYLPPLELSPEVSRARCAVAGTRVPRVNSVAECVDLAAPRRAEAVVGAVGSPEGHGVTAATREARDMALSPCILVRVPDGTMFLLEMLVRLSGLFFTTAWT